MSGHFEEAAYPDPIILPERMGPLADLVRDLLGAFQTLLKGHREEFRLAAARKSPAVRCRVAVVPGAI